MTFKQITPLTPVPEFSQIVIDANGRIYEHLTKAMEEFHRLGLSGDHTAAEALTKAIRAVVLHTEALKDYAASRPKHYFTADTDEAQACGHSWDNRKYDTAGRPVCELCDLEARLAVAEDELSRVNPPALTPKIQRLA